MRIRTLVSLVLAAFAATTAACTVESTNNGGSSSGSVPDGGSVADSGSTVDPDGGTAKGVLGFTPSNIDISGIDISKITDEDVSITCELRGAGPGPCFSNAAFAEVTQADQSKIGVYVVKSLKIEPTAHVQISGTGGNIPVAIVALGDVTILGTIDAHSETTYGNGGGFVSVAGQLGSGPGGGPKGTSTTGAGGGSYCGQGGQGNASLNGAGTPGAKTAASGNAELKPLRGGASGGGTDASGQGGAGGGALQIVASGTFTMGAGSYINAGGGGGGFGNTSGGGGAGGSVLIEATTVKIAGIIAANGGGGGGAGSGLAEGKDGSPDSTPAPGGASAVLGAPGSGGTAIDGATPGASTVEGAASGGGGGAGRIRINSKSGQADTTGATFSPALTTTCVTQGPLS